MHKMEVMLKKQNYVPSSSTSSTLSLQKKSHAISKIKPKIRIIHIFAPEIIKTDVENFRELVQRLTGKPTENRGAKTGRRKEAARNSQSKMVMEQRKGVIISEMKERIKDEEEIWSGANSGGGFLGSFNEFDGFMGEFNEFPFFPLDASHMDVYGEPQLA